MNERRKANEKNTSYFACVVYLSIAVNHVTDVDDEPENHAAKEIYRRLHRSPYRNYLKKERPECHPVVYFMVIDTDGQIEMLYKILRREGFLDGLKVL